MLHALRMSSVYLADMDRLSAHINTKLDTFCIFSQTVPPRRANALARCGIIGVKCLAQVHNDALPNSETEPRVDYLAVANLRTCKLHHFVNAYWYDKKKKYLIRSSFFFLKIYQTHSRMICLQNFFTSCK